MSRGEKYPWSRLELVGDHFVVLDYEKSYQYVSMMVSQRNYKNRVNGVPVQYSVSRMENATLVMVASTDGKRFEPDQGFEEFSPGVWMKIGGGIPINAPPNSQQAKITRMTPEERLQNLPWWWDPITGKPVQNPNVMRPQDLGRYIGTGALPIPGPEEPYPEEYNLDENLKRYAPGEFSINDVLESEDEDWGGEAHYE